MPATEKPHSPEGSPPVFGPALDAPARRTDLVVRAAVALVYLASVLVPLACLDGTGLILCPFRRLTGLPCPACGLTHAFVALGHGHPAAAWHYNAFGPFLYLLGVLWLLREMAEPRGQWPRLTARGAARAFALGLCAMLLYGAFRILVPSARPF